jgi:hypothetical protein
MSGVGYDLNMLVGVGGRFEFITAVGKTPDFSCVQPPILV